MSGVAGPALSLEQEPPAAAIKRFALLDSSDDDEFDIDDGRTGGGGGAGVAGAAAANANRFDSSKLDWSRLLEESSDATPSPPLRPKPSLAAQLAAVRGSAPPATEAPPAAATAAPPVSSFRKLALLDSDDSVDGASSQAARHVRSRPTATAARDTPPAERSASDKKKSHHHHHQQHKRSTQRAAPASLLPPQPADASDRSSPVVPPPLTESAPASAAAASVVVPPSAHLAGAAAAPQKASTSASATASAVTPPPPPPPAVVAAAPAKTRTAPQRPAALQTAKAPPAEEEAAPFSPGVVYTTVPQWTRGMKKRHGVYTASKAVANPTALYDRGMKGLQRAAERRDALRARLEAEERSAMPFSPVISPRANALKRSERQTDGAAAEEAEASQQLRHRLQLLELPAEAVAAAACRHSPRISAASARIVQECRERSGAAAAATAAGERLYQDHFYRQEALEAAQVPPPSAPLTRSQQEIDAHIATLYDFEAHRRSALASARDAAAPLSPRALQPLHVDPVDVVARLCHRPGPSPRRAAQALQRHDEYTFQPQPNANAAALVRAARLRGVERWVAHFARSATLPTAALLDYRGPAQREAQAIAALLSLCDPARTVWAAEELADVLAGSESAVLSQLWRRRPPTDDAATVASELTFHPTLNTASTAMVEGMESEQRCGPTHERLFLAAKSRQLTQRQHALEAEQAALEAAQRGAERKARQRAAWRAAAQQRLEAHRTETAQRTIEAPPQPPVAEHKARATPRRFRSPPQQQPQGLTVSRGRSAEARAQPSTSPLRPTRTSSSYAASLVLREEAAETPTSPPPRPVEVSPLTMPRTAAAAVVVESPTKAAAITAAPAPAAATSASAATTAVTASSAVPRGDGPATVSAARGSEDLSSAAAVLRQLLAGSSRPSFTSPRCPTNATAPAAPPVAARAPAATTPITTRDVNRPRDEKPDTRSVDVVLECAALRDPATVAQGERGDLERAQKRQLRELGRLLYNRNKVRAEDR